MEDYHTLLLDGGLMDQPKGLTYEIRALRNFAEAKRLLDEADPAKGRVVPAWAEELLNPVLTLVVGGAIQQQRERAEQATPFGPRPVAEGTA